MVGGGPELGRAHIDVEYDVDEDALEAPIRRAAARAGRESGRDFSREFDRSLVRGLSRLRGSRNDFANAIGSIAESFERNVFRTIRGTFAGIGDAVGALGQRFAQADGPIGRFGRGLERVGDRVQRLGSGGIDGLVIQLITMVGAFGLLVQVAGPVTSLLSAISANLLTLAVAVGGALAGGLLQLGPGLLALAAGATAASLGTTNLTKAQEDALDPLLQWSGEIEKIVRGQLLANIGEQAEGLTAVLSSDLNPILRDAANTMRSLGDSFVEGIQSPGFQESLSTLQVFLPGILQRLGESIGNTGAALFNMFAAASPQAQIFFENLNNVVERWNEWTQSEEGRQQIDTFLRDANRILGSIWDLIKEVSATFATFWEVGNTQGDRFIDKLAEVVRQFNRWLETEDGREALETWFRDAETIIEQVGEVLGEAGQLIDDLDSPENRKTLLLILNAFQDIFAILQTVVRWVNRVSGAIQRAAGLGGRLGEVSRRLEIIQQFARDVVNALRGVQTSGSDMIRSLTTALDGLLSWFGRVIGSVDALTFAIQRIRFPTPPSWLFSLPGFASGGIVTGPTRALVGEAGPEAIIPLDRPLSQVDPSVRGISALLQGQSGTADLSAPGAGTIIQPGAVTISTPYANPRLVALEVLDELVELGK